MSINYSDFVSDTAIALIQGGPCKLYQVNGTNNEVAAVWLQIFDKTTAPVDTDIPVETYLIQPGSNYSIGFLGDLGKPGRYFNLGLGIAFSTTQSLLTNIEAGTMFVVWWVP